MIEVKDSYLQFVKGVLSLLGPKLFPGTSVAALDRKCGYQTF